METQAANIRKMAAVFSRRGRPADIAGVGSEQSQQQTRERGLCSGGARERPISSRLRPRAGSRAWQLLTKREAAGALPPSPDPRLLLGPDWMTPGRHPLMAERGCRRPPSPQNNPEAGLGDP